MLPSAGTELLDVLICDLLFDLNSASVPESGQLCPILKVKELSFTIHTDPSLLSKKRKREAEEEGRMENGPAINLPVVLDVEILHVSDGRVDGVIEALGRWDLVV